MGDRTAAVGDDSNARGRETWWPVATVTVWQTTASVCFYTIFAGTALFQSVFGLSRTGTGFVITVLMGGYVLALLPVGSAVDTVGEKPAMTVGLVGLVGALVGVALSPAYASLLVAVFALGVCYATAIPATNRAILRSVPESHANLAIGVKQVGVTAGSGLSAVLVTALAQRFGWQSGFAVAAGLSILVVVAFTFAYDGAPGTGEWQLPDPRWLLAEPRYRSLLAAGFFLGGAMFTTTGYVTVYATDAVGTTLAVGGGILALTQVAGSVGRVAFGGLVDRLGGSGAAAGRVFRGQAAAATALLVAVAGTDSLYPSVAAFALLGLALLGFTGVYYSCLTALAPDGRVGEVTGVGQSALTAGAVIAPSLFGAIADRVGYDAAWVTLAAFCLAAVVAVSVTLRQVE